ncbi:hypothetical protein AVEN_177122-1, partial [Araneus ventricosus]
AHFESGVRNGHSRPDLTYGESDPPRFGLPMGAVCSVRPVNEPPNFMV